MQLHEARMAECFGTWTPSYRFFWPKTRAEWVHFEHNPHSLIEQAVAQAKAMIKAGWQPPPVD
jgi:hypothetical protein